VLRMRLSGKGIRVSPVRQKSAGDRSRQVNDTLAQLSLGAQVINNDCNRWQRVAMEFTNRICCNTCNSETSQPQDKYKLPDDRAGLHQGLSLLLHAILQDYDPFQQIKRFVQHVVIRGQ